MSEKYEKIGPREIHLLEEFAEVQKIICKAIRFGWWDYNPYDPGKETNVAKIKRELDDVEKRIKEVRVLIATIEEQQRTREKDERNRRNKRKNLRRKV